MTEPTKYDSKQKHLIHQLIDALFSDEELINFCAQHFRDVFNRFKAETGKGAKTQLLIERCVQQGQLAELLAAVKNTKPVEYEAFAQRTRAARSTTPAGPAASPEASAGSVQEKPAPLAQAEPARSQLILNPDRFLDRSLEDRYRINEVLDRSGLGAVFKAYDAKLRLDVAIKIIDLSLVKQPAMVERVRREVQTGKKLDHPCVVRIYDFGQTDSLLYIIMEYIAGYNLREARRQFKNLDQAKLLPQLLQLGRQICLTVDYLHHQGVLHPGTKPENIMLKPGQAGEEMAWRPVLINLGLLRPNREAIIAGANISSTRLTYTVSPELLLGHGTDTRSDVYTLGVILYDLIVGRPPFTPQDLDEAIRLHVEASPPEPRSINPDIPQKAQKVLLRALAKDPSDRYLSAKEMAQTLAACLEKPTLPGTLDHVTISMPDSSLIVTPGERLTTTIRLYNEGQQNTPCQIKAEGIPAEWVSLAPAAMTLAPGEEQAIELAIEPPSSPQTRARHYALTIGIVRQRDHKQIDAVKSILKVTRYTGFESSLWPQKISSEQITQITVENQGNDTETFTIRPKPERGLTFQPEQAQLKLAPGDRGQADFRVTPRFRLVGETMMQTFSFEISLPDGETAAYSGEIASSGMMSTRLLLAAATAIGLLLCVVFSFYSIVFETLPASATAQAVEAQGAAFALSTGQAIQSEATAVQAATETAVWLGLDSDGDDLLNSQEASLGSDPNNSDTDGDGLPDGKEVNEFGSDPRFSDSDFDGIPDNEEVRLMSSPNARDSDGDGAPDGLDIDLRRGPTATFTPLPTNTPAPTRIRFGRPVGLLDNLPRYVVRENQVVAVIDVVLDAAATQPISVDYALQGEKYRLNRGVLLFAPGETRQTFEVQLINDNAPRNSNEVVMMTLRNASSGAEIETPSAELVIIDDD